MPLEWFDPMNERQLGIYVEKLHNESGWRTLGELVNQHRPFLPKKLQRSRVLVEQYLIEI